jgi:hypothetical protein
VGTAKVVFGCAALMLISNLLTAGETVSDPALGFQLAIPDGFVRDPDRLKGDVIHAFQRPPQGKDSIGTFILVRRLGGVIDREKIRPEEVAAKNPQITFVPEKWKEFEIEVFRVPEQMGELRALTFNAQVPLKPAAIQLTVIGEVDREDELRSVLRSLLSTLDGQSNWLSRSERFERLGEGIARLAITATFITVIVVVVLRAVRKRKRDSKGKKAEPSAAPDGDEVS